MSQHEFRQYIKVRHVIDAIENDGTPERHAAIKRTLGDLASIESDGSVMVHAPTGWNKAAVGEFIIRGVEGEFYPCPRSVFEKSYQPHDGST